MNNRRNFLKQLGFLGVATITGDSLLSACTNVGTSGASGLQLPLGIQLYTLRDAVAKDVKGTIAKIAEAGYQTIETFGFSSKNNFFGITPAEFKTVLEENKLTAASGHYFLADFFLNGDTKELDGAIEAAATLKSEYFTIPALLPEVIKDAEAFKKVAEKINIIAEKAKSAGLKTAYHNHDFEFKPLTDGQLGYDILLKNTDQNLVYFEMDIYWVIRAGKDPLQLIKDYSGRFSMYHIKDMSKTDNTLNTEVGNGSINFAPILEEAHKNGLQYLFVEQENNYVPDEFSAIKTSADFIKANLLHS